MTKRWLSLVLVLTLLSTLFTGVAFAVTELTFTAKDNIIVTARTIPDDGTRTISFKIPSPANGGTVKLYYEYGLSTQIVPDPTASSEEWKSTADDFVLDVAGTYIVKAAAYEFDAKGDVITSKIVSEDVSIQTTVEKVSISPSQVAMEGRDTQIFTASVTPASASQSVEWKMVNDKGFETPYTGLSGVEQPDGTFKVTSKGYVGDFYVKAEASGKFATAYGYVSAVEVTDFQLPDEITIEVGQSVQLSGSVLPTNATQQKMNAASNDPTIAKVDGADSTPDANGVSTWTVTGEKVGTTTLTVKAYKAEDGKTTTIGKTVTVNVVTASTTPPAPYFGTPSGKVFTESTVQKVKVYTGVADNVSEKKVTTSYSYDGVTWNTKNSVDSWEVPITLNKTVDIWVKNIAVNGKGYQGESAVVHATYTSAVAATDMTVKSGAADVVTSGLTIKGANTAALVATLEPTKLVKDNTVTFTSSNPAVAAVDYTAGDTTKLKATVTGKSAGTATITVTSGDGKVTKKFTVTVKTVDPTRVTITPATKEIKVGQYIDYTAAVVDNTGAKAFNQDVTWSVDAGGESIVSVNGGKVVGLKEGKATVRATSVAKPSISGTVMVTVNPDVTNKVEPVDFKAQYAPGTAALVWTNAFTQEVIVTLTSKTDGATIYYTLDGSDPVVSSTRVAYTEPFKLSGPATGKIRAYAVKDGMSNSDVKEKTFTFKITALTITLPATATVAKGETLQLTPVVSPENTTDKAITWTLSNTDLASINTTTGLLTAKKAGVVKVTATLTNNEDVTASCVVTITDDPVASLAIIPGELTMNVLDEQQLQFRATLASKTTKGGTWTSSDSSVASVSSNGLVTARKAGEATITLTYNGQTATAKVTVNADSSIIPTALTKAQRPTYTAATKQFSGMGKGTLSAVVGKLTPYTGTTLEQLFYYYNVKVTPAVPGNTALEDEITFQVGKDGSITMNIANLSNNDFFFNYTVTLSAKGSRTDVALAVTDGTVNGNTVTITAIPTAINFTAVSVADTSLEGGKTATLDFGTIANYADFTATGVAVTATANVSGTGVAAAAAIDSNGKVTATVEGLVKGEYTVTVTLSASGCTSVTTGAAKVTVTSDKPAPVPVKKAIVVTKGTAYEGIKGVTQLAKADNYVVFDVAGLDEGVTVTSWKSSKPAYVAIDEHGIATLKKAGKAKITATMSDNSKLSIDVNVNKGSFADPADITLQTKPNNKWVDVTAEGITVVPKKSGQKSVPSRLNASDDGKIVIQDVEFSNGTIASRDGDNPSPIKVKKRSISDGETTTLTITANGAKFSVVIKVDSGAKDVYLEDVIAEIEEIIELEAE